MEKCTVLTKFESKKDIDSIIIVMKCVLMLRICSTSLISISGIYYFFNNKKRHELQKEIIDLIDFHLPDMNQVKVEYVEKRKQKELKKPKDERKEVKEAVLFEKPTEKKTFIGYGFLDALFKVSRQADYIVLPGQVNQQVMKVVFQNWKSFFTSLKDYKVNPQKYTGSCR